MENNVSTGVFQKHENNELTHVFLAFTQGKCQINRTFSDNRKRTVYIGFTWYSLFSKINGERGFSCRVFDSLFASVGSTSYEEYAARRTDCRP